MGKITANAERRIRAAAVEKAKIDGTATVVRADDLARVVETVKVIEIIRTPPNRLNRPVAARCSRSARFRTIQI
jgi:hypothetical protein